MKASKKIYHSTSSPLVDGFVSGLPTPFAGTVTDWVTEHVEIPHSSRSKRFKRSISPQWCEILDLAADHSKRCITVLAPPGGGKTTFFELLLSYIVSEAPGDTEVLSQTDDTSSEWAETRLKKVFEATEAVRRLYPSDPYAMRKTEYIFPHMALWIRGANMTSTQEKSLLNALGDEVWQWKKGLIKEFEARLHDRWNGKLWLVSQGGWADSELEERWLGGDQRIFGFTCPKCKTWHRFNNDLLKYKKILLSSGAPNWKEIDKTVRYTCTCGSQWTDTAANRRMLANLGSYEITNPDCVPEWASLQFSAFSVWQIPWSRLAREWIQANIDKENNEFENIRIYVMKRCVEFANAQIIESLKSDPIFERRENYDTESAIPNDVLFITAGVDLQDDRLEIEVDGWGLRQESWALDYRVFFGPPTSPGVWEDLDEYLSTVFTREDGAVLEIDAIGLDTGRHPNEVYKFLKSRGRGTRRFYAFKGSSLPNMPIVSRPKKSGVEKARLFMVGTDTAKARIYARLALSYPLDEKGQPIPGAPAPAGYMHYPEKECFDEIYFKQLVSEVVAEKKYKGDTVKYFKKNGRNEPLDIRVYSAAALQIRNPSFEKLAKLLAPAKSETKKDPESDDSESVEEEEEGIPEAEDKGKAGHTGRRRRSRRPRRRWGIKI